MDYCSLNQYWRPLQPYRWLRPEGQPLEIGSGGLDRFLLTEPEELVCETVWPFRVVTAHHRVRSSHLLVDPLCGRLPHAVNVRERCLPLVLDGRDQIILALEGVGQRERWRAVNVECRLYVFAGELSVCICFCFVVRRNLVITARS